MEMSAEKCATQIPFFLSQYDVPTLEKCCDGCTAMCARDKCAFIRVQVSVVSTSPVALTTDCVRSSDAATSVGKF